jgi:hypothetical protein
MSQSEDERSAKSQDKAAATDRELSDAELEAVAAAGDKAPETPPPGPHKPK